MTTTPHTDTTEPAPTPKQREERRQAGIRRRKALRKAGVTSYRHLLSHLAGRDELERRP